MVSPQLSSKFSTPPWTWTRKENVVHEWWVDGDGKNDGDEGDSGDDGENGDG
jgi:hypothetical protein